MKTVSKKGDNSGEKSKNALDLPFVLCVDDTQSNISSIQVLFRNLPIHLIPSTSGDDALDMVKEYNFSLIVIDVDMPGLNGFETIAKLRQIPEYKDIPILFISSYQIDGIESLNQYDQGFDIIYLTKAIGKEILRTRVTKILNLIKNNSQLRDINSEVKDNLEGIKNINESK